MKSTECHDGQPMLYGEDEVLIGFLNGPSVYILGLLIPIILFEMLKNYMMVPTLSNLRLGNSIHL